MPRGGAILDDGHTGDRRDRIRSAAASMSHVERRAPKRLDSRDFLAVLRTADESTNGEHLDRAALALLTAGIRRGGAVEACREVLVELADGTTTLRVTGKCG